MSNNEIEEGFRADLGFSAATPIASSNIGFQLLKKHGWKEGTGLGISEQGRLEPVQAYLKKNKWGLGADKDKNKRGVGAHKVKRTPRSESLEDSVPDGNTDKLSDRGKSKKMSKRMRKMLEIEKKMQEKEFERAFFREFWPDNV